jgi:hypothetical protein
MPPPMPIDRPRQPRPLSWGSVLSGGYGRSGRGKLDIMRFCAKCQQVSRQPQPSPLLPGRATDPRKAPGPSSNNLANAEALKTPLAGCPRKRLYAYFEAFSDLILLALISVSTMSKISF